MDKEVTMDDLITPDAPYRSISELSAETPNQKGGLRILASMYDAEEKYYRSLSTDTKASDTHESI